MVGSTDGGWVSGKSVELSCGRTLGEFVGDEIFVTSSSPIFSEFRSTTTFVQLIFLASNSLINADSKVPESIDFTSALLELSYQASTIVLHSVSWHCSKLLTVNCT